MNVGDKDFAFRPLAVKGKRLAPMEVQSRTEPTREKPLGQDEWSENVPMALEAHGVGFFTLSEKGLRVGGRPLKLKAGDEIAIEVPGVGIARVKLPAKGEHPLQLDLSSFSKFDPAVLERQRSGVDTWKALAARANLRNLF
ncbi:MAG: hypothetical protein IPJ65_22845 [Archangiaceae bacterium]|nr:hypothetical protein [Archangiaceae bacterium]